MSHTPTYANIRQHTPTYIPHTPTYAHIRQHTFPHTCEFQVFLNDNLVHTYTPTYVNIRPTYAHIRIMNHSKCHMVWFTYITPHTPTYIHIHVDLYITHMLFGSHIHAHIHSHTPHIHLHTHLEPFLACWSPSRLGCRSILRILHYLMSHYLTLPYVTLPYLTLPYLTSPYLTLPYLTLPYLTYLLTSLLAAGPR